MHIVEETVVLYIAICNVEWYVSREKLFLLTYLTSPLYFPLGCERGEKGGKKREREIKCGKEGGSLGAIYILLVLESPAQLNKDSQYCCPP